MEVLPLPGVYCVVVIAAGVGAQNIDAVCLLTKDAVDRLRRNFPLCLVDRLAEIFGTLGKIKSGNRFQCFIEGSAFSATAFAAC